MVDRRERACRGDLEYRAQVDDFRAGRYAIKVSIRGQYQSARTRAVITLWLRAKVVERGQRPCRGDLKDCAFAVGSTLKGCPVEIPIGALDETGIRVCTVSSVEARADREGLRRRGDNCCDTKRKDEASRS